MLDLMVPPIVAGLVILWIHEYLGLHVIARGVIFVDLAFAQIAANGATVKISRGRRTRDADCPGFFDGLYPRARRSIFSCSRLEETVVPQEAVIGITFVVASAAVTLIARVSPQRAAEHIVETLTGTLHLARLAGGHPHGHGRRDTRSDLLHLSGSRSTSVSTRRSRHATGPWRGFSLGRHSSASSSHSR